MSSDTFETHSRTVLEDLLAGLSEADTAVKHGISERTIQRWLQRGRDDPTGRYGEFATIVERGRIDRELPPEDERPVRGGALVARLEVWPKGNVRALQLCRELLAERRSHAPSPFDELDAITDYVR